MMTPQTTVLSSDRIQDTLYGFMRSQILFSALKLDVFTRIHAGDTSLDSLTCNLEVDRRGLRILLDGLIGIGFLEKDAKGVLQLPEDVAMYLVSDSPNYIGGMGTHCKRLYENWTSLTDAVRTGMPVGGAQSLAQLEDYFSELVKGLYVSNYPTATRMASLFTLPDNAHVLDVGGGSGVWSIAQLEKNPTAQATLLDFDDVIPVSERFVSQHQLLDRYTMWDGDLEIVTFPDNTYDRVLLGNICHALGSVATERLIKRLGSSVKSGGDIVIVDFVPDDLRSQPGWALVFGVNMLVSTPEGDVFTMPEYRNWLESAGFTNVRRAEIESEVYAVIAEKA